MSNDHQPYLPPVGAWLGDAGSNGLCADILETTPAMVWLGDAQGKCVYLNHALRDFWGVRDIASFSWAATLHPDDTGILYASFADAMANHTSFQVEARYLRNDGAWRVLQTQGRPRFDADGAFLGMVGVNLDVTERLAAERALRQSKEHLDFALEASGAVGIWVWDVQDDRFTADAKTWSGFLPDADQTQVEGTLAEFLALVHDEDRPRLCATIRDAMQTGAPYKAEYRVVRADGDRWVSAIGRCDHDAAGRPTRFAGVTVDIDDRHQREDAVMMLTRELSHRIKNMFTVVQMMTTLASKAEVDAAPALSRLAKRFQALASAHLLSLPDIGTQVKPVGLKALASQIVAPLLSDPGCFRMTGPDLNLQPQAANAVALMLNELATNAAKYGSLCSGGLVELSVESADQTLVLRWTEQGGPSVAPPAKTGFGSRLISASASSLGAIVEWTWRSQGLIWSLRLPEGQLHLAG